MFADWLVINVVNLFNLHEMIISVALLYDMTISITFRI
jgi:hypothetical protein